MKFIMILLCFALSGCATAYWHMKNEEFENEHKRPLPFSKTKYIAEYLGSENNEYVYKVIDDTGRLIVFRLSFKSNRVKVEFDAPPDNLRFIDSSILYVNATCSKERIGCEKELTLDHPQNIYLNPPSDFGKKGKNSSSYPSYTVTYSSKEGNFLSYISNDDLGISSFDTFVLGVRNTGYIVSVATDIAILPFNIFLITVLKGVAQGG